MLMYSNYKEDDMKKVSIASINFLYKQLRDLLITYEKKILISSDEERDALDKLKFIVMMLDQDIVRNSFHTSVHFRKSCFHFLIKRLVF